MDQKFMTEVILGCFIDRLHELLPIESNILPDNWLSLSYDQKIDFITPIRGKVLDIMDNPYPGL